ncbi:MAG: hypothetical protein Ct9H90mP2_06560 [Dehalococcoidia bacterium]|nr:MAG: hypothetical protein Ct9H90mP2_06560 [Dehalococcoidia bacterium]
MMQLELIILLLLLNLMKVKEFPYIYFPSNTEGIEIEKMESIGGEKLYKVNFNEIKVDNSQLLGEAGEDGLLYQK